MKMVPSRPWPPMGFSTAEWQTIEPETVPLSHLVLTQEEVSVQALLDLHYGRHSSHTGDPIPNVVRWGEVLYVEDGHHRILQAFLSGKHYHDVRIAEAPVG